MKALNKQKLIEWVETEIAERESDEDEKSPNVIGYKVAMKWVAYNILKGNFDEECAPVIHRGYQRHVINTEVID